MDQSAQDPALEARVGRLEQDMHEVKSTLGRLEPLIVSIHAQMPYLATKAEVERLRGDLGAKIEGLRADLETKMEALRADLETKMAALRADLQTTMEGLRGEVQAGFAGKPGFLGMWMIGATLSALVVAGMTAGAANLAIIARGFHIGP